jgi:hypothetical protein
MVVGIYVWITETFDAIVLDNDADLMTAGAAVTMILITLGIIFHGATFAVLRALPHFIIMIPSYVNIMVIFAMANMHDVTWGNRANVKTKFEIKTEKAFQYYRTKWLIMWTLSNVTFAYALNQLEKDGETAGENAKYFLGVITGITVILLIVRFFGSMFFIFGEKCCCTWKRYRLPYDEQVDPKPDDVNAHTRWEGHPSDFYKYNNTSQADMTNLSHVSPAVTADHGPEVD